MGVLVRIALRNLKEHVSKSVIIGSLIALGVVIIILGNSLLDSTERGVHSMFIDNYTGDVFISGIPKTPGAAVSLFGVQSSGMDTEITPLIPDAEKVLARVRGDARVKSATGQLVGVGMMSFEGNDNRAMAILFGVDPSTYPALFQDTYLAEGSYLKQGEEGLVVSRAWMDNAAKAFKTPVQVGDTITVNGFGQAGFKIRELKIVGVVDSRADTEGMEMIAWANADTVRILSGVDVTAEDVVLTSEQTALLGAKNEEDIFGESETTIAAAATHRAAPAATPAGAAPPVAAVSSASASGGSWHFLLARLKDSRQAEAFIAETNAWLAAEGIAAKAGGWREAAGPFVQSIDAVRTVFSVAILIVSIVSIIIIMNTLVISVIERTGEIGTMRALGAQKPFVWLMFLVETLTITIVFGIVGIALSSAAMGVVNLFRIPAESYFTQILFGGKVLRLAINPRSFLSTLLMVAGVGLVSHLYPVVIALKIPPVRAMQNE
jgi:putative ABC transport system permease protein